MPVMGFRFDPGSLPFITVRGQKWVNRLGDIGWVWIRGEHGLDMDPVCCTVAWIRPLIGRVPPHLWGIYPNEPLFEFFLSAMLDKERIERGIPPRCE